MFEHCLNTLFSFFSKEYCFAQRTVHVQTVVTISQTGFSSCLNRTDASKRLVGRVLFFYQCMITQPCGMYHKVNVAYKS